MMDDIAAFWYPDDAVSIRAAVRHRHLEVDLHDDEAARVAYRLRAPVDGLPEWLDAAENAFLALRRTIAGHSADHRLYFDKDSYFDRSVMLQADLTDLAATTFVVDSDAIEIGAGNLKFSCSERAFSRLLTALRQATTTGRPPTYAT